MKAGATEQTLSYEQVKGGQVTAERYCMLEHRCLRVIQKKRNSGKCACVVCICFCAHKRNEQWRRVLVLMLTSLYFSSINRQMVQHISNIYNTCKKH